MRTSTPQKLLQQAIAEATDPAVILKLTGRLTRLIEVQDRAKGRRAKARNKKAKQAAKAPAPPLDPNEEMGEEFEFKQTPVVFTPQPLSQSALAAKAAEAAAATVVTFNKPIPAQKIPPSAPPPNGFSRTISALSPPYPIRNYATGQLEMDDAPFSSIGTPDSTSLRDTPGFQSGTDCIEANSHSNADGFSWRNSFGDLTNDRREQEAQEKREREAEQRRVWSPFFGRT